MRRTISQRMRPTSARRRLSATSGQFILSPAPEAADSQEMAGRASLSERLGRAGIVPAVPALVPVTVGGAGELNGLGTRQSDVRRAAADATVPGSSRTHQSRAHT